MAAGTAGATPYLKDALNGVDIFVRKAILVREYQTKRNATVRTAQAIHLSEWIFGIPVEPATPPTVTHESEAWDEKTVEDSAEREFEDAGTEVEIEQDAGPGIVQHDVPSASTRVVAVGQRIERSSSTLVVAVGQRIELDLKDIAFAENPYDIRWTIPGRAVRGYDGTVNDAKLFELTNADLQQPKITFYWVDAADGRKVVAKFRLRPSGLGSVAYDFDVKGPTVNSFTGQAGVTRIEKRGSATEMWFGEQVDAPGVRWNWKITMPDTHPGYTKDVQTVLGDRSQILRLKPGGTDTHKLVWRHPSKTDPHVQLDGDSDDEAAYTSGLYKTKFNARETSSSGLTGVVDSPHTGLPSLAKTVSVNDQFTYYIMFKPGSDKPTDKPEDAIWVPIAKAKWFWEATANNRGDKWVVSSAKMTPTIDTKTVDFPVYQSYAAENVWQEASAATKESDEFAYEYETPPDNRSADAFVVDADGMAYFTTFPQLGDLSVNKVTVLSPANFESLLDRILSSSQKNFVIDAHGNPSGLTMHLASGTRIAATKQSLFILRGIENIQSLIRIAKESDTIWERASGTDLDRWRRIVETLHSKTWQKMVGPTWPTETPVVSSVDAAKSLVQSRISALVDALFPGGITDNQKSVDRLIKKMLQVQARGIREIQFRACNIGKDPGALFEFRKFFGADHLCGPDIRSGMGLVRPSIDRTGVDRLAKRRLTQLYHVPGGRFAILIDISGVKVKAACAADTQDAVAQWVAAHIMADSRYRKGTLPIHFLETQPRVFALDKDYAAHIQCRSSFWEGAVRAHELEEEEAHKDEEQTPVGSSAGA
jgi:hypothetical protein